MKPIGHEVNESKSNSCDAVTNPNATKYVNSPVLYLVVALRDCVCTEGKKKLASSVLKTRPNRSVGLLRP
jgi:hypothetical protein